MTKSHTMPEPNELFRKYFFFFGRLEYKMRKDTSVEMIDRYRYTASKICPHQKSETQTRSDWIWPISPTVPKMIVAQRREIHGGHTEK